MSTIISARELKKTYGKGSKQVAALKGVSFEIPKGKIIGLVGPNGAGKSTFIKTALGLIWPTAGQVSVFDHAPGSAYALKRLSYLPEQPNYPDQLSGQEFLDYCGQLQGLSRQDIRQRSQVLLEEVGIAHAAKRKIREYSKGMMQRIGLAQAMIGQPELLILDEPMSGLDPLGRADVKRILRAKHAQGTSIIFCSHILEDVERLCDELIILIRGHVRYRGRVADVLASKQQGWYVLIKTQTPPVLTEAIQWEKVSQETFSAQIMRADSLKLLYGAAAAGQLELLELKPKLEDLEDVFLRFASEADTHA